MQIRFFIVLTLKGKSYGALKLALPFFFLFTLAKTKYDSTTTGYIVFRTHHNTV